MPAPAVCLAEARSPYAQRFAAARALGMYLVDHSGKLVLLTGAEVTRQQFSRAFAAEFLAPREQLRARLGDYADEDDILELSEEFGVSERVIRHQIANNKLARLVESPRSALLKRLRMTKWITIALSIAGLALAGYVVATSGQTTQDLPPAAAPTVNPFADGIAASGSVEASTRNLTINAPTAGLVIEVLVEVNDRVAAGQPLFKIDDRELRAQLLRQEAALVAAEAEVARLRAMPRPEDLPPLRAAVERARTRNGRRGGLAYHAPRGGR